MRCETARECLVALMDGELSGFAAWRLRQHVVRCSICNQELVTLRNLNDRVKSLDILSHHPPAVRRLSAAAAAPTVVSEGRRRDIEPGGWKASPQEGRAWTS